MATGHQRQLAGLIRAFCGGGALLWLLFCLCVVVFQKEIFFRLEVSNATAVWILLPVVLLTLWSPVMNGLLQGRQNFLWLGWSSLLSSVARLLVSAAAVLAFRAGAARLMTGLLVGAALTVGIGVWQNLGILKLTRAAPSTGGREKTKFLSVKYTEYRSPNEILPQCLC